MTGTDLTVRQLEYVVAVADTGSLSAAARACFVSQPTLSAQVAAAERTLGVQLFVRHARRVEVTAAGQVAVVRARAALRAVRAVADAARWAGVVRIGAIETVGPYLFGPWLAAVRDSMPEVSVRPSVGRTAELVRELDEGSLDAAVLALPVPGAWDVEVLGEDPLWLASPAGERVAAPLTVSDLAGHEMLLLEEGHCLRDQVVDVCAAAGAEGPYAPLPGATLGTLVEMVASGLGCTLVPEVALSQVRSRTDVALTGFGAGGPVRTLVLCHRGGRDDVMARLAAVASGVLADCHDATGQG